MQIDIPDTDQGYQTKHSDHQAWYDFVKLAVWQRDWDYYGRLGLGYNVPYQPTYFLQKLLAGQLFKSRQYKTNIVANLPETFPGPAT